VTSTHNLSSHDLRVKIFADGADVAEIRKVADDPLIAGFTTNPTLMRKAGVDDYEQFARELLEAVPTKPVSLEVFSDDEAEMERQANKLAALAANVFVKIPVTDTTGRSTVDLVARLARGGVRVNVTAILGLDQVAEVVAALAGAEASFVSVFAGRVADTGRDPVPHMTAALALVRTCPGAELIWASPREVLNIVQADAIGCDIITVTNDLLAKLPLLGKELGPYSLETVQMFHADARSAGYEL
jgi:transaldolase